MSTRTKRPAFQFYPADWRKDMALQSCSVAARGLWIEMLCIAHECMPYGHLTVNGNAMTTAQIGRHVGITAKECDALLAELTYAGVLSRTEDDVIFSRRMVRDEELRERRAAGGQGGAEHGHKGAKDGLKGGRPKVSKGGSETPLAPDSKPPPSSSSSPSGVIPSEPYGSAADGGSVEPVELIFSYGVPLLTAAGNNDKHARSFLAGLRKAHGDELVIDKLRECARARPLQPLEWLAAALPPRRGKHAGFTTKDYRQGVTSDGSLA